MTNSKDKTILLSDLDLHLFNEGTHIQLGNKLGSHRLKINDQWGTHFAVWAPSAKSVNVIGNFNDWSKTKNALAPRQTSGIWETFIPGVECGSIYKYWIVHSSGHSVEKADPFAFRQEEPPRTASIVWDLEYRWNDHSWMQSRQERHKIDKPLAIYEVHLGSWRRVPEEANRSLSYREVAPILSRYVLEMGFTHVEILPIMEHPFYGSWGYQTTGYFAPTSRFGLPQDFMFLIDHLHQAGIGVILDWVPSHFPTDGHGLSTFDGTSLYEHADPRQGFHPDWKSAIFNYGRNEVQAFLISNALFWLDKYHVDALRVDAVASMLYLDYSRKEGEWIGNRHGGRENLEAISFIKKLNEEVYRVHPDVFTVAEESTAWAGVSRPTSSGGLGFGYKWDMGWMHDSLKYLHRDPIHRKHHQNEITFRALYQFSENYVLPLSHDEVVHGKGSLIAQMPGDDWQKFANLRLLFAWQWALPGKKLLFMGGEFAQREEWNHDKSLEWHLTQYDNHQGISKLIKVLNQLYCHELALHQRDCDHTGFEWVDAADSDNCVLSFLRKGSVNDLTHHVLCIFNFTPVPRTNYRVGVPHEGEWQLLVNTDASQFGGAGISTDLKLNSKPIAWHGRPYSVELELPPLAAIFLNYVSNLKSTK